MAFAADGGNLLLQVDSEQTLILSAIIGLGVVWIVLGVLTCLKQMWAVYAALVLSYLSALGNILQLAVIAIIIMVAVIAQAHRVIVWARQIYRAGVPLTAKPSDFSN